MEVVVKKTSDDEDFYEACTSTLKGERKGKPPIVKMLQAEHSPIRLIEFKIKLKDLFTFISVHLVRHNIGVSHFVETNRDDRGGEVANRFTPVKHLIKLNAQALINISRKRLCYKSHKLTVGVWTRVRKEVIKAMPEMENFMSPECVYRNGLCPEITPCKLGPKKVCSAYPQWPGTREE